MHDTAIYLRKRIIGSIEKEPPRPHNPEVVGSNPAPATKNLQLVGLAGELFCYSGTVFFGPILSLSNKISICNI